jgi:hypothetical protein
MIIGVKVTYICIAKRDYFSGQFWSEVKCQVNTLE